MLEHGRVRPCCQSHEVLRQWEAHFGNGKDYHNKTAAFKRAFSDHIFSKFMRTCTYKSFKFVKDDELM